MNFFKKLFLLFFILFFTPQAWAMDSEEPSKSICLMHSPDEYGPPEWLEKFANYCEQKGRQKQRLESEKEYTPSCVRFVKDIPNLTVGYGMLSKDQHPEIAGLQLSEKNYQELAEIGTTVKIINGYIQKHDKNVGSFTPNTTNVFVPHISYVIQWKENTLPELVPGGMLHDENESVIVFISGEGKEDSTIKEFYNHIYKKEKSKRIVVYSGHTVKNKYTPYRLRTAVENLDIFKNPYLAQLSVKMTKKFYLKENPQNEEETANKALCLLFSFLSFLLDEKFKDIFSDTTQKEVATYLQQKSEGQIPQLPEEAPEQRNAFVKVLQDNQLKFIEIALQFIKSRPASKLKDMNKNLVRNVIGYMKYCLMPQKLDKVGKPKKFWDTALGLSESLRYVDQEASSKLHTKLMGLRNKDSGEFTGSHTEPLFIKLIRSEPQLLTQSLKKIINTNPCGPRKPKLLGLIVDSFSWLDTCKNCSKYLNNNKLWSESLELITSDDIMQHFDLPVNNKIDSLFRIVAQECYGGPPDISKAEGGKDYTASGWDYRVLSEMRYTLATRTSPKESQLWRDRIFERIPTAVTKAALTQSIEVWKQYYAHWPLTQGRPFANNVIEILSLRFPEHKVIKIIKIEHEMEKKNFKEVSQLAESFKRQDLKTDDTQLFQALASSIAAKTTTPVRYLENCLNKSQEELNNTNQLIDGNT